MSIAHHPPETMLADFAAGRLDPGQHVAIATHLASCPRCRDFVRAIERAGGDLVTSLAPAAMAPDALDAVMRRLPATAPEAAEAPTPPATVSAGEVPRLPRFLRSYHFGPWRWVAPAVHVRAIALPHPSDTRVFLLRSGPGTRMLQHSHSGFEMTCILSGAFKQDGDYFGPGDFDFGDESIEHRPLVEPGEDCLCLVAMQGDLKLKGLLGRIVQPFVRL